MLWCYTKKSSWRTFSTLLLSSPTFRKIIKKLMVWDILKWFLVLFFGLFFVWVISGGPSRGGGTTPIITGPEGVGGPLYQIAPAGGEVPR